ncbi:MAG TPA: TetR/AcrR family transcriptional regulator [Rectinemataceae bacterium]|nr:TetR/AcrR family transcriptional regulator [Rectinemataceae bacterium]
MTEGLKVGRGKKIVDTSVVVEAAIALIETKGFDEFSTRRLAAELRISAMTLYNYYDNRDAILKETVLRGFQIFWEGLPEKIDVCYNACANPLRVYAVLAEHLIEFAVARPNLYRFLFWADLGALMRDQTILLRYREAFTGVIERVEDRTAIEAIGDDVYLFEVLINALAMNVLAGRSGMSPERYRELASEGYDRLLGRHEAAMRA